jgi:hypothetical protein
VITGVSSESVGRPLMLHEPSSPVTAAAPSTSAMVTVAYGSRSDEEPKTKALPDRVMVSPDFKVSALRSTAQGCDRDS